MLGRLMLIWLVVLHEVVPAAFGAGGIGTASEQLSQAICAPSMPCVTELGCCCEVSPTEERPQQPEPITSPTRGLELIPIPTHPAITWDAADSIEFSALPNAQRIEPAAQLRRLARMCVWRT